LFNVIKDVEENLNKMLFKNIKKSVRKYFKIKEKHLILRHKEKHKNKMEFQHTKKSK
jgi:hypothetical protein